MSKVKAWIMATRLFVFPWMLFNTLLGVTLAGFNWKMWGVSFLATLFWLFSAHFINSWRDYARGLDSAENGSTIKPYTAGAQVLPLKLLTETEVIASAIGFGLLSIALLVTYAPLRLDVILVYAIGPAMAITYTDFFKPRGLGEIALFLGHGFGATTFAYSLLKPVDATGLAAGILLGFWAGIIYTLDQWPDVETDFQKKIKTVAYYMMKAKIQPSQIWMFLATGSMVMQVAFVLMGLMPQVTLWTVLILPISHFLGIILDYDFPRGVIFCLGVMMLFPLIASIPLLIPIFF